MSFALTVHVYSDDNRTSRTEQFLKVATFSYLVVTGLRVKFFSLLAGSPVGFIENFCFGARKSRRVPFP